MSAMLKSMSHELKAHAPFTIFGALAGVGVAALIAQARISPDVSHALFWTFHPAHVLLSALVTTGMYRLHARGTRAATVLIGYCGSIGIATLSDCAIPYLGEYLLNLPNRGPHLGFIEMWWLVNPLALAGIAMAFVWPRTRFPHAGHVLLSTSASLFHITMALGTNLSLLTMGLIGVFLFLAVWVPCCTSDIVFPLLFAKRPADSTCPINGHHH